MPRIIPTIIMATLALAIVSPAQAQNTVFTPSDAQDRLADARARREIAEARLLELQIERQERFIPYSPTYYGPWPRDGRGPFAGNAPRRR